MASASQPSAGKISDEPGLRVVYRERLWVSIWLWLLAFAIAVALATTVLIGTPSVLTWLPYSVLPAIAILAMISLGRTRIEVTEGPAGRELQAGDARIPTRFIDRAAVVPSSARSAAMGRQFDPAAYAVHRPWIGTMVIAVLNDPDDPTPYWIFSTRHPEAVVAALGLPSTASAPTMPQQRSAERRAHPGADAK